MYRKVRKVETTARLGWGLVQSMVAFLVVAPPVARVILAIRYWWVTLMVIAAVLIAAVIVFHAVRGLVERNRERTQRTVAGRAQLDMWLTEAAENHARLQLGTRTRNPGAPGLSAYKAWLQDPADGGNSVGEVMSSITGPRGVAGDQGAQGPKRHQGNRGQDGESAYQLRLETTPNCTIGQVMASHKGAPDAHAPQDPKGDKGDQCVDGPQGPQGLPGANEPQGPKGDSGREGPQGPADGPQGAG